MKKILKSIYWSVVKVLSPSVYRTKGTAGPITFKNLFVQKVIGINRCAYWPMHFTSKATGVKNIKIGIGTAPGLSPGCYIQGKGKIFIGDYTIVGPNVGIISANHDKDDLTKYDIGDVRIGDYCCIGMNSVILPNVVLGNNVVVGAGSVVTKSFEQGNVVIGGNPAKVIRTLDPITTPIKNKYEYYGYIKASSFETFRKKKLSV